MTSRPIPDPKTPPEAPVPVPFYLHSLGPQERQAITRVLRSLFLTTGPETAAFEREFAAFLGVPATVGVSSCTEALFLSLVALGIGPGDEVITSPITFVSTANAIVRTGATCVFADVEDGTGLLDPAAVEAALTPRTRAVLPVHLYGQMADMRAFRALADRRGLWVVEDAAHCVEGSRDDARPGTLGDTACFSFYATKNLTCGEGGAIACRDPALADRLRRLRLHGIDRDAATRHGQAYRHWDMLELGYKANLNDLQAALLRPQLQRLPDLWRRRERLARRYDRLLQGIPGVRIPPVHPGVVHARHLYTVQVPPDRRDDVLAGLQARGIGVAVNFRPVHRLSWWRDRLGLPEGAFPRAERLGASTVTLPLYPRLTHAQQDRVVEALQEVLGDR
ncbi:MAG TPA: DegT/DnrJ/EryC1/StrS family aminotransferase [Myxococcota bacterium]|nr:DegT/DnrJ/EryC1/StrS family aminotransferase [Myxococcota bacterium]HQK52218.1 DegT/DnrJ/EryC1/StrS family aminotransferase [Myxococcota bacterium]